MRRPGRASLLAVLVAGAATGAVACGEQGIQLASNDRYYRGAELFAERCAGCHTLKTAGTQGSATSVNSRERKDGPNFNQRAETRDQVLYAIENGGFSSGPMPQDIVVGDDAKAVADFVAKFSGQDAQRVPTPKKPAPSGF